MANLDKLNRFEFAKPGLDISRSRFSMPHSHKTTFSSGKLVPIGLFEVLPSDTWDIDIASVLRMVTPVVPTMDNAFLDIFAFFVPNRIACIHDKDWEKICGENVNGFWAPMSEATLYNTGNTYDIGGSAIPPYSPAAYYGLPISSGSPDIEISTLPFVGYVKIWNEWFRDQNTQAPISLNDYISQNASWIDEQCLSVNKLHDYFTSCLPSPQKGESVLLPLGGFAPVYAKEGASLDSSIVQDSDNLAALEFYNLSDRNPEWEDGTATGYLYSHEGTANTAVYGGPQAPEDSLVVTPKNLVADLTSATAATVNQLRQAFAIQRMLEKDARGGSRYREILRTHYGSHIPDNTIQIPQYLGGKRVPLNITQVLQTSSSDSVSPLGATGAFSNTSLSDKLCVKSFDEHGFIHVFACVRPQQTYSQGISKFWTRNRRYDWYYPSFANLGEQIVYKRELKADSSSDDMEAVFGYQEAWAEYRFLPNRVSGELAPNANNSVLTPWTYTNNFSAQPTLNSEFMVQPDSQIGDTLVITGSSYQFISDFYFDIKVSRPMPLFSIPGLIDHH